MKFKKFKFKKIKSTNNTAIRIIKETNFNFGISAAAGDYWASQATYNGNNIEAIYGRIEQWDTSEVTNMEAMFLYVPYFNKDIGNWNTSNVTNMDDMFQSARYFNKDISRWDTSKVTSMRSMFYNAESFNKNINTDGNKWNTSKVTDMRYMFGYAESFNQDISGWSVENVDFYEDFAIGTDQNVWPTTQMPDFYAPN